MGGCVFSSWPSVFQYFSGVFICVGAIGQVVLTCSSTRLQPSLRSAFPSILQKKVERHLAQFTGSMTSFKSLSDTAALREFGGEHEAGLTAHDHHLGLTQRHDRHFGVDQPLFAGNFDDLRVPVARVEIKPQVVE